MSLHGAHAQGRGSSNALEGKEQFPRFAQNPMLHLVTDDVCLASAETPTTWHFLRVRPGSGSWTCTWWILIGSRRAMSGCCSQEMQCLPWINVGRSSDLLPECCSRRRCSTLGPPPATLRSGDAQGVAHSVHLTCMVCFLRKC